MFAYIKEGKIVAVSEHRMTKRVDAHVKKIFETRKDPETEEDFEVLVEERVVPAIPGLVFDAEIETDLEGELDFLNGEVVQKIPPLENVPIALDESVDAIPASDE